MSNIALTHKLTATEIRCYTSHDVQSSPRLCSFYPPWRLPFPPLLANLSWLPARCWSLLLPYSRKDRHLTPITAIPAPPRFVTASASPVHHCDRHGFRHHHFISNGMHNGTRFVPHCTMVCLSPLLLCKKSVFEMNDSCLSLGWLWTQTHLQQTDEKVILFQTSTTTLIFRLQKNSENSDEKYSYKKSILGYYKEK